jgi:hypothetical protein
MFAKLVELVTPTGVLDGSLFFKTLLGLLFPVFVGYALRTAYYHPSTWCKQRELVIMLFRPYNIWFLAKMCYSHSKMTACHKKHDMIAYFASALAPCVYRLRFERQTIMDFINITGSVFMPGILCDRSAREIIVMLGFKAMCSVPVSVHLYFDEKRLRIRLAQKFADKQAKWE